MQEHFNVNFNVSFNIFLEQSSCAFGWINKGRDNIKMHGKTVKKELFKMTATYILFVEPVDSLEA